MTKKCTKCEQELFLELFGKKSGTKDGLNFVCKPCLKIISKEAYDKNKEKKKASAKAYYEANREQILSNKDPEDRKLKSKQWRDANPEKRALYKKTYREIKKEFISEYNRQYKKNNRDKIQKQWNERIKRDPMFKMRIAISKRLWEVAKNKGLSKNSKYDEYLGCSNKHLFNYLESKFISGMSWSNHGLIWEIDHIIPLTAAKTQKQLMELSHYTNLQPLFKKDNREKSNKITKCWQKFQKDKNEESDRAEGFPFNLNVNDFILNVESFSPEHRSFIAKYEWLGTVGFGVKWVFTARWENKLAGVVMLSEPNSYQFGEKEALIQRGAVSSWAPKNLNSRLVMFACRWMVKNTNKRYFVAYSDPSAGEIGTIYQACNFDYLGQKYGAETMYKLPEGQIVNSRYFTRTSSMKKWAKELNIVWDISWTKNNGFQIYSKLPEELKIYARNKMNECEKIKQLPKGKYVLLLNYGKEKLPKLWEPMKYPKRI